jgi:transcriptional regulatory protein RtcR
MPRSIVIGFLGTKLDRAGGPGRWDTWRPSVAFCQQDDFRVDRFDAL